MHSCLLGHLPSPRLPATHPAMCSRSGAGPKPASRLPSQPPPACLQRADLAAIVAGYLSGVVAGAPVEAIVDFYLAAKAEAVSARVAQGWDWASVACLQAMQAALQSSRPGCSQGMRCI